MLGDKLWITGDRLVFVWVRPIVTRVKREGMAMIKGFIHSYSGVFHMFSQATPHCEQGFSATSTAYRSGYYDYLYIYRSRCETNLSLRWERL